MTHPGTGDEYAGSGSSRWYSKIMDKITSYIPNKFRSLTPVTNKERDISYCFIEKGEITMELIDEGFGDPYFIYVRDGESLGAVPEEDF